MPWIISRVDLSTSIAMYSLRLTKTKYKARHPVYNNDGGVKSKRVRRRLWF